MSISIKRGEVICLVFEGVTLKIESESREINKVAIRFVCVIERSVWIKLPKDKIIIE